MISFLLSLLLTTSVFSAPTTPLVSHASVAGSIIPDHYIIVFKDSLTTHEIKKHWEWLHSMISPVSLNIQKREAFKNSKLVSFDILHTFELDHFKAYAAKLPKFIVKLLSALPEIAHIEPDRVMTIFGTQSRPGSWGIERISTRNLPLASTYTYPDSAGTDIDAYVIDTGIFIKHPEFEGRAFWGKSFTQDGNTDGNGHGTHCAGTIGSKTYGVAKNVTLWAVKVLDAQGSGSTSSVIAGIDYVAKEHKRKGRKSVASMSLGGGASTALDKAVQACIKTGVVFAVAAGNSGKDACKLSPARVPEAITVAASDKDDNLAYFSERGPCVDIIAPGVDITSLWNDGKLNTISGTSMATPHVAGVVALALSEGNFSTVAQVHDYIKEISSKNKVTGSLQKAPNNLLFNNVIHGTFPDEEPREPKTPDEDPEEPEDPPKKGECPFPQCLMDPECTSCCIDCWLWL